MKRRPTTLPAVLLWERAFRSSDKYQYRRSSGQRNTAARPFLPSRQRGMRRIASLRDSNRCATRLSAPAGNVQGAIDMGQPT